MKQNTHKSAQRNTLCFAFLLSFGLAFSQTPTTVFKSLKTNVEQLPAIQNLKKNQGLGLYGEPREGLQVAAKNGQMGFVSRTFDWIIEPQYDYAFSFHEGYAIVFLDGKAMYIDKQNRQPFKTDFAKHLAPFQNGRAIFKTHSGKMGLMDKEGRILTDTIFKKIYLFDEDKDRYKIPREVKWRSATVAKSFKTHLVESVREVKGKTIKTSNSEHDFAIIDTIGRFLVPFGAFRSIEPFQNGYATAHNDSIKALFDSDGKEVFRYRIDEKRDWVIHTPMQVKDKLIRINFPNPNSDYPIEGFCGLLNFRGEVVYKDTTIISIHDYDDKKAIVRTELGFEIVFFEKEKVKVIYPIFKDITQLDELKKYGVGAASIWENETEKYGIIDSCFNWKRTPQYDRVRLSDFGKSPYFTLTKKLTSEAAEKRNMKPRFSGLDVELNGLADLSGKVIFKPEYDQILPVDSTFNKFHFMSANREKSGIIDRNGKILSENIVFIDTTSIETPPRYMSQVFSKEDYKLRIDDANCKDEIHEELGLTKRCNSYKKVFSLSDNSLETAQIVFSETDTIYTKKQQYSAKLKVIKAQLLNPTRDTIFFKTDRNELQITIQAKDKKGNWRDISVIRNLFPAEKTNKLRIKTLGLPPQYFWEIHLPTYNGFFKTQCRAIIKTDKTDVLQIVSKEWEAGINAAQFWKSPMYSPDRIFRTYGDLYEEED